jgi:hypothetical protein
MSRTKTRQSIRGCILTELITSRWVTPRQQIAAAKFLHDAELAASIKAGMSTGLISSYGGGIPRSDGNGRDRMGCALPGAIDAVNRYDALLDDLKPSQRSLLGAIQRTNTTRKGSLAGLPVRTCAKSERDDVLIKRGVLAGFLEVVADFYQLPVEA